MRKLFTTTFIALAVTLAVPAACNATILYAPGDLLLGFHATGGQGANDTYVYNLGPATQFRDAGSSFTITSQPGFSTLGADLATAFGANWFSRLDLFWGAAAVYSSAPFGSAVNGDPTRTLYVSVEGGAQGWTGIGQTDRASAANSMAGFQVAFSGNDGTAASSNRGAIIPSSQPNDWAEFNARSATGPSSPSFGAFNPSIETIVGNQLDFYRILNTTSGANPGGAVGDGTYLGTFTNTAAGVVAFDVVPEPSTAAIACLGGALLGLARRRTTPCKA